ncbi:MAG: tail fiber domain-containing protein [Lachnospiraceae bacterium]|nr:tail fiber domain-containing protein [Lachnospiraceae bacterium]
MTLSELDKLQQTNKIPEVIVDLINDKYIQITAKQMDTARYLLVTVTEDGIKKVFQNPQETDVRIRKPDGHAVLNEPVLIEDGRLLIELTEQILAVSGCAEMELSFTDKVTGKIYSTKTIHMDIVSQVYPNDNIISSYEFDKLNQQREHLVEIENQITENESIREENETDRIANESLRQQNEIVRKENETARIANESLRDTNENHRQEAEAIRISNEENRINFINSAISNHNTSINSHNDIRELINVLDNRLNALADSDDTTLDQLSEIVAYIKSNRTLIENVTTNKVNVSDVIDNLTSTATNKPLSANQGKILKDFIDDIIIALSEVDTKITTSKNDTINFCESTYAKKQEVSEINRGVGLMQSAISLHGQRITDLETTVNNMEGINTEDLVTTTDLNNALTNINTNSVNCSGTVTSNKVVVSQDISAAEFKAGLWTMKDERLYADTEASGVYHRIFMQPANSSSEGETWVISSQYKDGNNKFQPFWYITAQGKIRTLQNVDADGIINTGTAITLKDDKFKIMPTPSNTNNLGFYNYSDGTGFWFNLPITVGGTIANDSNDGHLITSNWFRARFSTTQFNPNVSGSVCLKTAEGHTNLTVVGSQSTSTRKVDRLASNSSGNLTIYGEFGTSDTFTARNVATTASDIRLKSNIKPTEVDALKLLNQIEIVQFDWNNRVEHWKIGMIADEIEKLDPTLTIGGGYDEDGIMDIKGINDFYLLGYCVKAIQELSAENNMLHEEINMLKEKIEVL